MVKGDGARQGQPGGGAIVPDVLQTAAPAPAEVVTASRAVSVSVSVTASRAVSVTAAEVTVWRDRLGMVAPVTSDGERVDLLRGLEELKAAACAAQARLAADLDTSVRAERAAAGVPADERGRGIGTQVALARRESPNRGGRLLGLGKALAHEMPHTLAALEAGVINEWRATLLVRESACLTAADRAAFDAEMATDPDALSRLGDKRLVGRARQVAYRLDPRGFVDHSNRAEKERCVTLRPAPATMTYLTGLLPMTAGVTVYAELTRAADSARAQGDARSRGQVMADTLYERVTGHAVTEPVPLEIQVVMTGHALLAGGDEPAAIPGHGTVPAAWVRDLLARTTPDAEADADGAADDVASGGAVLAWIRRLFTHPGTGELVAMDSRRRTAPPGLTRFVTTRDQTCRTPWCDAPIRHIDHIIPAAHGGPTDTENLQGLCEACNYTKQAPGWSTTGTGNGTVATTSPTGHSYTSVPPTLPGASSPLAGAPPPERTRRPDERHPDERAGPAHESGARSPLERLLAELVAA